MIRAKMYVENIWKDGATEVVRMTAVTPTADQPENEQFWTATPCGSLQLCITNPAAQGQFERGKYYYIDLTLAP